jgi:uncharacterized protein (DUF362 family)
MSATVAAIRDPDLPRRELPRPPFDPPNHVYDAVETVLELAGTPRLEGLVEPGAHVLIKPNFVTDRYYHERLLDSRLLASSTHASVIRPMIDFALELGASLVTVADTPIEGCDLESVTEGMGFRAMIEVLRGRGQPVRFLDLRPFRILPRMLLDDVRFGGRSWNLGILQRRDLAGDPAGYRTVDIGESSRFHEVEERGERLRFHRSHPSTPLLHHTGGRHEYGIPQTVLDSDVIIHVPKLKTHKKSGVTISLKSSIGLCGFKYWLPHYTAGLPPLGDEYPTRVPLGERLAVRLSRLPLAGGNSLVARAPRASEVPPVTEGSWEGNDTIWRTTLDLARIHLYADAGGQLQHAPVRRFLSVVDGIVAGEGEGPFGVRPVELGLLLAGTDPVLVDAAGAEAMGFDWRDIPTIARAADWPLLPSSRPVDIDLRWRGPRPDRAFAPPRSWPSLRATVGQDTPVAVAPGPRGG